MGLLRVGIRVFAGVVGAILTLAAARAAEPDLSKMSGAELVAFTRAMPKGGELHLHLSGAIYPETFLRWAVEDGLCVDTKALSIVPICQPAGDLKAARDVLADDVLRTALYDSLTTRKPGFADRSPHDQFFTAFGRMGASPKRGGDMLALVMDGLAAQNTFYLEAMVTPQGGPSRMLGAQVGWRDDLAAQKAALTAAGLENLVPTAIADTDAMEARARSLLKCGTDEARPGCGVVVRYLVQTSRQTAPEQTFAQVQLGVALIAADRRWVGIQLVAPEDHPVSLQHYRLHMRIIDFLTDHGRAAPAALHAGELGYTYATPEEMSFHVSEAVRVAGARRIGHGVAIAHENGAEALAAELAAKGVLVEVNLTSNDVILGVTKETHPYAWLRARGVPTSFSTDDPGILRIDLSHEYARAAREGATYGDLKASARNALAFSFLPGEGLWLDPGRYRRPRSPCAGEVGKPSARPGGCAALLAASEKASQQFRLEHLLREFEKAGR